MLTILLYSDKAYESQAQTLLNSFRWTGKTQYQFLYYTIGFTSEIEFPNLIKKEWTVDPTIPRYYREPHRPLFEFYKPSICLDALQTYDNICFLDTDIMVSRRFSIERIKNDKPYPRSYRCAYNYPYVYQGDKDGKRTIFDETSLMGFYGVQKRTMDYVQSCLVLFNRNCIPFIKEWILMCQDTGMLADNIRNYPFKDETAYNVCLWKWGVTDNLGYGFVNTHKFSTIRLVEESDTVRKTNIDDNPVEYCDDSSRIQFYHGIKTDETENTQIFSYYQKRNNKMKICQVTPGLIEIPPKSWGAVEKIIWQYKLKLEALGHTVDIKYLDDVNASDYDVVHIHVANLALISHERGIPYVFTFHDHHAYLFGKDSDLYKQNLQAMQFARTAIVPAQYLVEYFNDIPVYLPHGVDTCLFVPDTTVKKEGLLCVGNNGMGGDVTVDRKGFGEAILAAQGLDMPITVCGPRNCNEQFFTSHPELEYYRATLKYDLTETELIKEYQKAEILIHETELEAGHPPLTILEAMACGTPVIGTFMGDGVLHPNCEVRRGATIAGIIEMVRFNYPYYSDWYSKKAQEYAWENIVKRLVMVYGEKKKTMRESALALYGKTKAKHTIPIKENHTSIKKNIEVRTTFVEGARVEILSKVKGGNYRVDFIDKNTHRVVHTAEITNNMWTKTNRKYYTDWDILITDRETNRSWREVFNLTNRRVYIRFESSALGDTLAWIPYAEEFRKLHNCTVICATFHNDLFRRSYPKIQFVRIEETVQNVYARYDIGWFHDIDRNPVDVRTIPLQKTASDILGLDYVEIRPALDYLLEPTKTQERNTYLNLHKTI